MKIKSVLGTGLCALSALAVAQTERDLSSHVHGQANINIVMTEDLLAIEFESPWNNLLGFEHAVQNTEQRVALEAASTLLQSPQELFVLDGGACEVEAVQMSADLSMQTADAGESSVDQDHPAEAEHYEHDEHGKAEDDHAAKAQEHDTHDQHQNVSEHSEVLISYSYHCEKLQTLASIDLRMFELWPALEQIDATIVGSKGQKIAKLSPQQNELDIVGLR